MFLSNSCCCCCINFESNPKIIPITYGKNLKESTQSNFVDLFQPPGRTIAQFSGSFFYAGLKPHRFSQRTHLLTLLKVVKFVLEEKSLEKINRTVVDSLTF